MKKAVAIICTIVIFAFYLSVSNCWINRKSVSPYWKQL